MPEPIVVTGLGVVSAIGVGRETFWRNILAGKSGVSRLEAFDPASCPVPIAGEAKPFDPRAHLSAEEASAMGRSSQLAVAAARLALEDGGRPEGRCGVYVGTTMGEARIQDKIVGEWLSQGRGAVSPEDVRKGGDNVIATNVTRALKMDPSPECQVFPTACAAGNYALSHAFEQLQRGRIRWAIAGGADALSRVAIAGFGRMLALSPDRCRPFAKDRAGIIIGEGAAMLVLEPLSSAKARGARIYAELKGYGQSCEASHMTIPHPSGAEMMMRRALAHAGVSTEDVDYVCAHGTGTRQNDKSECEAIARVFGERSKTVPVSSLKSMLGHAMGAASAIEAVACVLAVAEEALPPTINYETPDPDCRIDCVPNVSRRARVRVALNNAFAFGGNNCATVFTQA